MRRSVCVLGLTVLLMGTSLLRAEPIDPVYSMGDPATGTPVTSSSFNFGADALGGGVLSFINESGILWNDLSITVTEPTGVSITVRPGLFFNTPTISSMPIGNGLSSFTIGLFNTEPGALGGIANDTAFTINLNDLVGSMQNMNPGGLGGWGANKSFTATANIVPGDPYSSTPEPASVLLLALGLGLVWWGSRQFRSSSR